jgi:hypothetical protein
MTNTKLNNGDRVTVQGVHSEEGRTGMFVEYTQQHGLARVRLDSKPEWKDQSGDVWLVHPENLQVKA